MKQLKDKIIQTIYQLRNHVSKFLIAYNQSEAWHSFSQCGEDLIVNYIFSNYLKIERPTYIDIGAHHPFYLSNTYYFYLKGSHGVCIEPDPDLFKKIKLMRQRDVCINAGIGDSSKAYSEFFVMTTKTLNTFSKKEAKRYESYGNNKIENVLRIPLLTFSDVINSHFKNPPNFVSLDVEGNDLAILQSINLEKIRPQVFCIETLTYVEDKSEKKITSIIEFMEHNGYFLYADTYINSIFIDKSAWQSR